MSKVTSIRLRISIEDKAAIEEKATDRKLTVTEYLTRAGLGRSARQRVDVDAINLLRECVDELREIKARVSAPGGSVERLSDETLERTMTAVCAAIQRVWRSEADK